MAIKNLWNSQQEASLLAWHQLQQNADSTKPAACVTVAREFGCQAYPVAEALVARLNARTVGSPWIVVDRQILDDVAKLSGYSVEQIEKSHDTPASLKAIFSMFLDRSLAEETEVFAHLRTVVRGFAKRGNCVVVGRGSVFAVQDLPNCFNMRLVAPLPFRVQQIMKSHDLSETAASEFISLHQKQRDDFICRFATVPVADASLYHLVINNAHLSVEKMAALIDDYLINITA